MDSCSWPGPKYHRGEPTQTRVRYRRLPLTSAASSSSVSLGEDGLFLVPPRVEPRRDRTHLLPIGPSSPGAGLASAKTAGSMELFDAGVKGRGLRATKEISTGEVVFAEPSYAAVVYNR